MFLFEIKMSQVQGRGRKHSVVMQHATKSKFLFKIVHKQRTLCDKLLNNIVWIRMNVRKKLLIFPSERHKYFSQATGSNSIL